MLEGDQAGLRHSIKALQPATSLPPPRRLVGRFMNAGPAAEFKVESKFEPLLFIWQCKHSERLVQETIEEFGCQIFGWNSWGIPQAQL